MITLQELIYDISQIWREDNKASFEQKYFETKTSIEHYTEQLHKPVVGGPASASVSEGEQLGNEAWGKGVRDWQEDFAHENGNYQNKCVNCGELFIGHKRRPLCKICG